MLKIQKQRRSRRPPTGARKRKQRAGGAIDVGAFSYDLRGNVPTELKYYQDTLGTMISVGTTVVAKPLAQLVANGPGINQRIGNAISATAVDIIGTLIGGQSNLVTDDAFNTVRISLVEGFPGTSPSGWTVSSLLDPRYFTSMNKVWFDKIIVLRSPSKDSTGYMPAVKEFKVKIRLPRVPFLYTGNSGASIKNSELYLCMVSDSSLAPNPGFKSSDTVTFEYSDM